MAKTNRKKTKSPFAISTGRVDFAKRIGVYGEPGAGKTTLAIDLARVGKKPLIIDLDEGSRTYDCARVGPEQGLTTWQALRDCLQSDAADGYDAVVIDSMTRAEEMAQAHVLASIPTERGVKAESMADYKFGKDMVHTYSTFIPLLSDLMLHLHEGRHVVLVCHGTKTEWPNPRGEDLVRWEPRLQSPRKGTNSIREKVVEWLDVLLWIEKSVEVKDGKAVGGGTRTIHPDWTDGTFLSKSRLRLNQMPFNRDGKIWEEIFNAES